MGLLTTEEPNKEELSRVAAAIHRGIEEAGDTFNILNDTYKVEDGTLQINIKNQDGSMQTGKFVL